MVGTVVVGLADTVSGRTWTGTSGAYVLSERRHPVMEELLRGIGQAEDWPVNACAEVDAMNKWLIAMDIKLKSQIPPHTLFFHAQTWNQSARDASDQRRPAHGGPAGPAHRHCHLLLRETFQLDVRRSAQDSSTARRVPGIG